MGAYLTHDTPQDGFHEKGFHEEIRHEGGHEELHEEGFHEEEPMDGRPWGGQRLQRQDLHVQRKDIRAVEDEDRYGRLQGQVRVLLMFLYSPTDAEVTSSKCVFSHV